MNGVLFRRSARSLWKTWVVFAAVLSLYVSCLLYTSSPKSSATPGFSDAEGGAFKC